MKKGIWVVAVVVAMVGTQGRWDGTQSRSWWDCVPPYACAYNQGSDQASDRGDWEGVDKTVIERFAEQAGRPARAPWIDTDRGDLLLFLFLTAGMIGGFIAGYTFRTLFPPRRVPSGKTSDGGILPPQNGWGNA